MLSVALAASQAFAYALGMILSLDYFFVVGVAVDHPCCAVHSYIVIQSIFEHLFLCHVANFKVVEFIQLPSSVDILGSLQRICDNYLGWNSHCLSLLV